MRYWIEKEKERDGLTTFTVRNNRGIIVQEEFYGNTYYDFLQRKNESVWIVYGSDCTEGLNFFDLTSNRTCTTQGHISEYQTFTGVLANPTGEYIAVIGKNYKQLEFINIRNVGSSDKPPCHFVWILEHDDDYEEENFDRSEWISDYTFMTMHPTYNLLFDMTGDLQGRDASVRTEDVTLFDLLLRKLAL